MIYLLIRANPWIYLVLLFHFKGRFYSLNCPFLAISKYFHSQFNIFLYFSISSSACIVFQCLIEILCTILSFLWRGIYRNYWLIYIFKPSLLSSCWFTFFNGVYYHQYLIITIRVLFEMKTALFYSIQSNSFNSPT